LQLLRGELVGGTGDSVGGGHEVAAQIGGSAGAKLTALADQSFVDAMTTAASVAAIAALVGAAVATAFLPSRAPAEATFADDARLEPVRAA
jgi:hypothetical protein